MMTKHLEAQHQCIQKLFKLMIHASAINQRYDSEHNFFGVEDQLMGSREKIFPSITKLIENNGPKCFLLLFLYY